jgi:hypothetical protein
LENDENSSEFELTPSQESRLTHLNEIMDDRISLLEKRILDNQFKLFDQFKQNNASTSVTSKSQSKSRAFPSPELRHPKRKKVFHDYPIDDATDQILNDPDLPNRSELVETLIHPSLYDVDSLGKATWKPQHKGPKFGSRANEYFDTWKRQSLIFFDQFDLPDHRRVSPLLMCLEDLALKCIDPRNPITSPDDLYDRLGK